MSVGKREVLQRRPTRAAAVLVVLAVGCAGAQRVSLGPMLAEARANELAAVAKYRNQRLAVSGTVISSGLRPVEILVARRLSYPTSTVGRGREHYPYVYVADPSSPGPDRILCYFPPDGIEQAAKLVPGTTVTLEGKFQEFARVAAHVELILKNCELE